MTAPNRSFEIFLGGDKRSFPTYDDLVTFLISSGRITDEHQLFDEYAELLGDILFRWIRGGQMSCRFAKRLAREPRKESWLSQTMIEWDDPRLPWNLEAVLRYAADALSALQLIFPKAESPEDIARIIGYLCAHDDWYWEEVRWRDCKIDGHFLCGLRWKHPEGKKSWVLGFGPFDCLPFTRRFHDAPLSALVFRTRATADSTGFDSEEEDAIHLAHMNPRLSSRDHIERVTERTQEQREAFLADEDCAEGAKARVTFCLPETVRQLLEPR